MYVQDSPKTRTAESKVSPKATVIFRNAYGESLEALGAQLGGLSTNIAGLHTPVNPRTKAFVPRILLVKKKELGNALPLLHPSVANSYSRRVELAKRIPSLTAKRDVTATYIHEDYDSSPIRYFISVWFDDDSSLELGNERADIWHTLEEISGLEEDALEWKEYNPDLQLVMARKSIPKAVVQSIAKHIKSQLPMPLTLDPVIDPSLLLAYSRETSVPS